ncbi:DUF5693 family protein [Paenibacillus massiliensis]|uniref:DUF5693 family protein n=1 Tax=Paenibacillus massiliensis TaxID=225917 RepID=UPI0003640287|nr:DUF5693 family protein [Paenibacillus massiliensis]
MVQKWQRWNIATRKWLWIIVILGLAASIPVIVDRLATERSSKTVEIAMDYRNLTDVASYQARPLEFLDQQLDRLHDAGVTTMSLYESTLEDFRKARRLVIYNEQDASRLMNQPVEASRNFTYVLFTSNENGQALTPLIEETFSTLDIPVQRWELNGLPGLIIEAAPEDATLKPTQADPIAMENLRSKGFFIMPRLNDSMPYDQQRMERQLATFQQFGVKRILFEGDAVKGFAEQANKNSLNGFAELLNKYDIGLATIENLKQPQLGFNKLAYLTDYNVARLYSLSQADSALDIETLADRFALAAKDRNIRIMYLNPGVTRNVSEAKIKDSLDNIVHTLQAPGNAIQRIENNGFTFGQAEAFQVSDSAGQRYFKLGAVVGAIALISLMVSFFVPVLTIPAFAAGLVGSAGLYVLNSALMEQAIALLAAISAPTIAVVLAARQISKSQANEPELSAGRRLSKSLTMYIWTSLLSLAGAPFVIALLNNISYSLVLNQFRGVSLLHLAPIMLVAIYIFFYRGMSIRTELPKLLRQPVTILMVILLAVVGAVVWYYLKRTGNAGSVSSLEMSFRTFLESTFGVRPRNKEFLMAHPIFIAGTFIALKYRKAIYVLIIAVIGQLSMVDTFAHIHSPADLSLIRGVLGLVLGLIIGLIGIGVWQLLERGWRKWSPLLKQ